MDTSTTPSPTPSAGQAVDVAALIDTIKRHMPEVYDMIKRKAAAAGNDAYVDVRCGLRGEPNRFWAFEGGRIVGTAFDCPRITAEISMYMVEFGVRACVIWSPKVAVIGKTTAYVPEAPGQAEAVCS